MYIFINPVVWYFVLQAYFRWRCFISILLHYMKFVWLDVSLSDSMMCKKVADPLDASFTLHDKFVMTWRQPFRQPDVQEGGRSTGRSTTCGGHLHSAQAVPQREHQLLPGLPGPVCPVHRRHHGQVGACLVGTWLRCVSLVLSGQLRE